MIRRLCPALGLAIACTIALAETAAAAATLYVANDGSDDGNDCTVESAPCQTLAHSIAQMASGDTLIVEDGVYTQPIRRMPSGTPDAYTTIRARHDWGVTIDGSEFPDEFLFGIHFYDNSYVHVQGFHVRMNQSYDNNTAAIAALESDHIKIIRCGGSYAPTAGNASTVGIGPGSSYVLIEESYAFGGGRYQYQIYQSHHVIVRRSVARNDYWTGSLQCAGFVNYDSTDTVWQNNIALDSDNEHCSGTLYGGFWHENKDDFAADTSELLVGNIVLNFHPNFGGNYDPKVTGTHDIRDMVIWGGSHGATFETGPGDAATVLIDRMTVGDISGNYDGPNDQAARGTGVSVYRQLTNSVTNSLFLDCNSLGVADHTVSDYNAFFGNGANYGGATQAAVGPNDVCAENGNELDPRDSGLLYLPRIEAGSALKTAGEGGGQIGAEIVFKTGRPGTLHGEPGWDELTGEPLWPFPNEDQIKAKMAAYDGPGAPGARGFATGTSIDGTPQTLTKYVWEYLGNEIPADIYGLRITADSLPDGYIDIPYRYELAATGGEPPYAWALTGELPAGLSFDPGTATIAGTPSRVETATVTIELTDAADDTTSKQFQLAVRAERPDPGGDGDGGGGDGGDLDSSCGCHAGTRGAPGTAVLAVFVLVALGRRRRR